MIKKYILPLFFLLGQFSYGQEIRNEIQVRIPVERNEILSELEPLFSRENYKNDSLVISIPDSDYEKYSKQFPGLKKVASSVYLTDEDMASSLTEALTFTKYPTYEQYDSMMHYFADNYPSICRIDTFGLTDGGHLLLAVKISDNVEQDEDEPAFLYTSTMHGDELVGYVLTLRLIDFLLSNYGTNVEVDRIVNDLEVWINPLSNPDYTFYGSDVTVANSTRPYGDAVDLNRNFPDASLGDENDTTGLIHEIQLMMLFLMEHEFNISGNIHSGAELINYPWDYTYDRHPDDDWLIMISREYADECHAVNPSYLIEENNGITHGADWYPINHGRQDYVNCFLHGRELTLELSGVKKLSSSVLNAHWNYNQWSFINLLSQARYGVHGKVINSISRLPVEAKIWVLDHDNEYSWVKSDEQTGNFYRYLKEGIYDLEISAEGYITDTIKGVEVFDYEKTDLFVELDSLDTSIKNIELSPGLRIYPNPACEFIIIENENTDETISYISFFDLSGREVHLLKKLPVTNEEIDITSLSGGVYFVKVITHLREYTLQFVKE